MGKPIVYVVCGIFYYDTLPFVCLLDGEVRVPAKGVEALEFLFGEVRVCGCHGEVLVRLMYCSSVGLEDKGGIQSDLTLNECLGGSVLFLKKCLILRDLENLSKSDNRFFMLRCLGVGMKPSPLERNRSEVWSKGWLLKIMYLLLTLLDVEPRMLK